MQKLTNKELNKQFQELKKTINEKEDQGISVTIPNSLRLKVAEDAIKAINKIMDVVKEDKHVNVNINGCTIQNAKENGINIHGISDCGVSNSTFWKD